MIYTQEIKSFICFFETNMTTDKQFNLLLEYLVCKLAKKCPIGKDFKSPTLMATLTEKLMQALKKIFTKYQHYSVEDYSDENFFMDLVDRVESILLLEMNLYDEQFHNGFIARIEILVSKSFVQLAPLYVEHAKLEIVPSILPPTLVDIIASYIY